MDCIALFAEGDGGLSKERQLAAYAETGLKPTVVIDTTSKSLHFVTRLAEPLHYVDWILAIKRLRKLLNEHEPDAKWDESLAKPSQVLRLAGSIHPKTGLNCRILEGYGTGGPTAVGRHPPACRSCPRCSEPISRSWGNRICRIKKLRLVHQTG